MPNTWKTTIHDIVQVDQSTFDFPKNTIWFQTYQDQEPSKPLPVTYSPESNDAFLDQNGPDGTPRRFMGRPKGEWSSTSGEATDILVNMFKNKESAINNLTIDITADYSHAYWIDPSGKIFQVRGSSVTTEDMNRDFNSHSDWISANIDMLVKDYGFKPAEKSTGLFNVPITVNDLINAGWIRVGDAFGTDWGITVKDLKNIPPSVDNLLAQFAPEGSIITVATEDAPGKAINFEWPVKSVQQTVMRDQQVREQIQNQPVMAKQASIEEIDGLTVFVNPTEQELMGFSRNLKGGRMFRGLLDSHTGDLYVWDAYDAIHTWVIQKLGLDVRYSEDSPFCLYFNPSPLSISEMLERQQEVKQGKIPRSSSLKQAGQVIDVHGIRVYKNPTLEQAQNLLKKSKLQEMRGFMYRPTNDLFIWDAFSLIHYQVKQALGIDDKGGFDTMDFTHIADGHDLENIFYRQNQNRTKKQAGDQSASVPDYLINEWKTEQINNDTDEEPYVNHDQRDYPYGMHDSPENTGYNIGWPKDNQPYVVRLDILENPAYRSDPFGIGEYNVTWYSSLPQTDGLESTNPD